MRPQNINISWITYFNSIAANFVYTLLITACKIWQQLQMKINKQKQNAFISFPLELNETVICTNDHMEVVIPSAFFLKKEPPVYVSQQ